MTGIKRTLSAICAMLMMLALFGCQSGEAQNSTEIISETYKAYADTVDEYLGAQGFHGSVLVGYGDEIVIAKGYGEENAVGPTVNTAASTFDVCSIGDQVTATAVMQLAESGKLDINATLESYFPEFDSADSVTILNLLQMNSGIADFRSEPSVFFNGDTDVVAEYNRKLASGEEFDHDFLLSHINDRELKSEPGAAYYYSATNYYLLGLIIEQASGMTYQDYVKTNIFDRCGMTTAQIGAASTAKSGDEAYVYPVSLAGGACTITAGVQDVFKFDRAFWSGKLISSASVDKMTGELVFMSRNCYYGYGVSVLQQGVWVRSGSSEEFFASDNSVWPDDGISVVILVNEANVDPSYIAGDIHTLLAGIGA